MVAAPKVGVRSSGPGVVGLVMRFREAAKLRVAVGVLGGANYQDGTPLALVAAVNEYGSADGRIPQRSFLRSTIDRGQEELSALRAKVIERVMDGKLTPRQGIGLIGQKAVSMVQRTIASNVPPPNAPSTIRKKGSATTLIDTGQLRQGITFEIREVAKP